MSEQLTVRQLPTLAELYEENLEIAFKQDQFNSLMNQPPSEKWVKNNPFANNSKYIPVGIIETLLTKIFKVWHPEILREGVAFNAVYVVVRLHFLNLMTNKMDFHDGIGAVQLQTKKDTSASDLININNNAVMMAFPMAKSYALKDAAEHIGKLFGRDLNRKDVLEFTPDKSMTIDAVNDKKEKERLLKHIMNCKFSQDLRKSIGADILEKYGLTEFYELQLSKLEENELTK